MVFHHFLVMTPALLRSPGLYSLPHYGEHLGFSLNGPLEQLGTFLEEVHVGHILSQTPERFVAGRNIGVLGGFFYSH
jgi:hypothetical protein